MADNKVQIAISASDEASAQIERIRSRMKDMGSQAETMSTHFKGMAVAAASTLSAFKAAEMIKESTMLAARVETLGIVMKAVGNNAGYTATEMKAFQTGVAGMGITTQESMGSLIKMAGSQMDLAKASQLARVAQDAAVIGNINSSEAFGRMIQGIRSGELEILKNIGINVQFEESYKKAAKAMGKTTEQLSAHEKMQIRTNSVLEYGVNISGAYEASMSTAGKQIASMARYTEELKLQFGETFRPVFTVMVMELTEALKGLDKGFKNNADSVKTFGEGLVQSFQFVKREMLQVSGFLDKVGGTATSIMAALYGPGMMSGNKNSTEQFDKWMARNKVYEERYKQNRFDLTDADAKMRNTAGNDPGEQAWITGRNIALETERINASRYRTAAEKAASDKAAAEAAAKKGATFLKSLETEANQAFDKWHHDSLDLYKRQKQDEEAAIKEGIEGAKYLKETSYEETYRKRREEIQLSRELIAARKEEAEWAKREFEASDPWAGAQKGLQAYADSVKNLGTLMENFAVNSMRTMENSLLQFTMTGKASFKDMANSIISDLVRITIQKNITGPLSQAIGRINWGGMFGGGTVANYNPNTIYAGSSPGPWAGPAYASGTDYVPRTGLALIHQGEAIIPASENRRGAAPVIINIQNNTGTPMAAKQGGMQFDGKSFVINTIIENVQQGGVLRGMMA